MFVDLPQAILPAQRTEVRIAYGGHLTPYTEIGDLYVRDHIDTAFTILRSDALAYPVIGGLNDAANRRAPSAGFTYEAAIRVPTGFVVATGGVSHRSAHADGTSTWTYTTSEPSPFLNISIARFDTLGEGGIHIFHFRDDSLGARRLMANAQAAIQMLTNWFGPQQNAVNLTITEIPDGWGSQADRVGGIIQSAAAFRDTSRVNELYHELSHLWNVHDVDTPSPRWNEGLASFLEALLKERINNCPRRRAYEAWYVASARKGAASDSTVRKTPFVDYGKARMTDWSYSVGAVMFATLYDLVGEQEFNKIVAGYYQRFAAGGSTRQFVEFAKGASTSDIAALLDDWMLTTRWTAVIANATSIQDITAHYRNAGGGPR
jgi:hypothetical protein